MHRSSWAHMHTTGVQFLISLRGIYLSLYSALAAQTHPRVHPSPCVHLPVAHWPPLDPACPKPSQPGLGTNCMRDDERRLTRASCCPLLLTTNLRLHAANARLHRSISLPTPRGAFLGRTPNHALSPRSTNHNTLRLRCAPPSHLILV